MTTKLPDTQYLILPKKLIKDKDDFYKSGIKEASKIRNLITVSQRIFMVPSSGVNLYLVGEKDIYCIEIFEKKFLICRIYYLPKEFRLDLYDESNPYTPMLAWKSKKCVYKNIPLVLERIKVDSLLLPLLSVL